MIQPLLIPILHEGVERYQLGEPWGFSYEGLWEDVPLGLVVDGASVPRIAWTFMPPDGLHRAGSLAHDWLYLKQGCMSRFRLLKRECDDLFCDMLVQAGVSRRRAGLAHWAVKTFGNRAWRDIDPIVILPPPARPVYLMAEQPPARTLTSHLYAPPAS
jgi:hypothetical protein